MHDSLGKPSLCPKRCSVPFAYWYLAAPYKLWTKYSGPGRWKSHLIHVFQPQNMLWNGARKYSCPSPLQYLPLLGPSRAVSLQEGAGQHHPQGNDSSCYLGLIAFCSWGGGGGMCVCHGGSNNGSKTGSGKSDSLAEPLRMLFIC